MSKTTINDIANRTGLSATTISRVLSGKSKQFRISESSVKKVMEAAKELNYRPNFIAQNLRNKSSHTIGLLIPGIDNPFFANIANAVINEAHKYTYTVMLLDTHDNPTDEENAIDTLIARNVDGIIVVPCGKSPQYLLDLIKEIPIVLIDRYFEEAGISYVATDNYQGALEATSLLIAAGHKDILCIQGNPLSVSSRNRIQGYTKALENASLSGHEHICGNDFTVQNGYVETKLALESGHNFTAIFALSNTILLGAIKAISEHGLNIPSDISVISFDDNLYLDFLNPPITRISQPIDSISTVAVKMLLETITRDEPASQNGILLPPSIIYRSSVAPTTK